MYISQETPRETQDRLLRVLSEAHFRTFDAAYAFVECPLEGLTSLPAPEVLALVRDEDVWSQLKPSDDVLVERFGIFSFHFEPEADNSGFVGWLASHLKTTLGTGVFVVCGQNSARGGIFDYWGCPLELRQAVLEEIERLHKRGQSL